MGLFLASDKGNKITGVEYLEDSERLPEEKNNSAVTTVRLRRN